MENKDFAQSNKMIAEFMELKMHDSLSLAKTPLKCYEWNYVLYAPAELKFHTSWDWLMPVVEKIESMGFLLEFARFCDSASNYCKIGEIDTQLLDIKRNLHGMPDYQIYTSDDTKIGAVYKACVHLIEAGVLRLEKKGERG